MEEEGEEGRGGGGREGIWGTSRRSWAIDRDRRQVGKARQRQEGNDMKVFQQKRPNNRNRVSQPAGQPAGRWRGNRMEIESASQPASGNQMEIEWKSSQPCSRPASRPATGNRTEIESVSQPASQPAGQWKSSGNRMEIESTSQPAIWGNLEAHAAICNHPRLSGAILVAHYSDRQRW